MAHNAVKTEHAGAKHGNGAYWGRKADAKAESNRARRVADRAEALQGAALVRDRTAWDRGYESEDEMSAAEAYENNHYARYGCWCCCPCHNPYDWD